MTIWKTITAFQLLASWVAVGLWLLVGKPTWPWVSYMCDYRAHVQHMSLTSTCPFQHGWTLPSVGESVSLKSFSCIPKLMVILPGASSGQCCNNASTKPSRGNYNIFQLIWEMIISGNFHKTLYIYLLESYSLFCSSAEWEDRAEALKLPLA